MDINSTQTSSGMKENISPTRNTENEIYFNFSYSALKLLGKNLYSNPTNAISELVANALDAKASNVYVYIDMSDKAHSVIEIIDDGSGMSYSDLAKKYVWVGRNKRDDLELNSEDKQSIMGRKGIGKLAALYLSNRYYILTRKDSSDITNQWEVNLTAYADSDYPKLDRVSQPIQLVNNKIWNTIQHGTAIILENVDLRRNGDKKIEGLRRVFADFYLLDAIKSKIYIAVKTDIDEKIVFEPIEKKIAYKNFYALFDNSGLNIASNMLDSVAFTWASDYPHIANKPRETKILPLSIFTTSGKGNFQKEDGSRVNKEYELSGWIAIHCTIDQNNAIDENFLRNTVYQPNRLRLYVRNKLAVADYFNIRPNTQAMANYIEGEISFNILDDDDLPDIATSSRQDFLEDERVELLISIVDPIVNHLFTLRNNIGKTISDENNAYRAELLRREEEKRKKEEEARIKAEEEARIAEQEKQNAEIKQKEAEAVAHLERRRSQYILNVSDIEDKNIMNSVHSIYNMSNRVKENLDEINNLEGLSEIGRKKLEKASTSNQRILSVSKLISKAGRVIDDNDAAKNVNLTVFINEYAKDVLNCVYDPEEIKIDCTGDVDSTFMLKIKPLSFIMMIDNLIGNAIKAEASVLSIIIDNTNCDFYSLIFKDNGKGIDSCISDVSSLFEFGVTTTHGSGLGLYYAKKHMKELKGFIEIKRNEDVGISVVLSWKK